VATPYKNVKAYEAGILLTGVTNGDLTPTDRVYFSKGADRVTHTLQLYRLNKIKRIIITGGVGELIGTARPEAELLKEALLLMKVPAHDIIIENKARNTHENAKYSKVVVDSLHLSSTQCLLITSAFHMRRSRACFKKVGLDIDTFTVDFYSHKREFGPDELLIPRIEAMMVWHKLAKEWVGMMAYKVAGYI
jgi:uncharacterized SAM-binding protein YcdF (DUF218 family)